MPFHCNTHHRYHTIGHSLLFSGFLLITIAVTALSSPNMLTSYAFSVENIIDQTNTQRQLFNRHPLTINSALMQAAQAKAEHMVQNHYFAHFSPDGTTPWEFIQSAGYAYAIAGENLAITNQDERAVIQEWMNSPTHKDNILQQDYSSIGIGMAFYGDYEGNKNATIIVALYASPSPTVYSGLTTNPTNPAGPMAIFRPTIFGTDIKSIVILMSMTLAIAGISLEIRHILQHSRTRHA